jgi:ABC-type multidrug transport system fused ATPase/permease subunit
MYFIGKLESYEIDNGKGVTAMLKDVEKIEEVAKYQKVKKHYSLLNIGQDLENYKTIQVFLFEELANEELARLLKENKNDLKGYEVIEYGQKLKDTIASMINVFKFQVFICKDVDKNGKETGNYRAMEPCDFHTMVIRVEETKKQIKEHQEEYSKQMENQKPSKIHNIKYYSIKAIDTIFSFDIGYFFAGGFGAIISCFIALFNHQIGVVLLLISLAYIIVAFFVGAILLFANLINESLYFCFRKAFNKYYK